MRLFLFGVFVLGYTCVFSQDSLVTLVVKDTVKVHSPKKAVIFSAIIPGAGQVYNHIAMPKRKLFGKSHLYMARLEQQDTS